MTENQAVLDESPSTTRGRNTSSPLHHSPYAQRPRCTRKERVTRVLCDSMPWLNFRVDLTILPCIVSTDGDHQSYQKVTIDAIRREVICFMNRLNGYVLKVSRKTKPAPKLDALIVLEYAGINRHPHLHGLVECPPTISPAEFKRLVEKAWDARRIAAPERYIRPVRDLLKSVSYNLKSDDYHIVYYWHEPDETAFWRPAK